MKKSIFNDEIKDSIVLIDNVTTGINSILRSFSFTCNDSILLSSNTYPMIKEVCKFIQKTSKVQIHYYQASSTETLRNKLQFLASFESGLKSLTGNLRVVIMDHIISLPGFLLPLKEMIILCKKYKVISIVDAAHAIGQVDIDLSDLDPDFYVTNLYKWMFSPKGYLLCL